jgi:ribA/ribD-fused uncharacterized protein
MSEVINFYDPKDTYYEFSNFYGPKDRKFKLYIDGHDWKSAEHYYQASKFLGPDKTPESEEYARIVGTASTPNKAFVLAKQVAKGGYAARWVHSSDNQTTLNELIRRYRSNGVAIRADWESAKEDIMLKVIREKFKQNRHLAEILIGTRDAVIHEHTSRDKYWGDGGDGSGRDRLGQILMQVRSEIRTSDPKNAHISAESHEDTRLAPTIKSRVYDLSILTNIPSSYSELRKVSNYFTLPANVKKAQMIENITEIGELLRDRGVSNLNDMIGPIYNSNWVIPGKLLVGAYPGDRDPDKCLSKIKSLIEEKNVAVFVSLQTQNELSKLIPYQKVAQSLTNRELKFYNFPIEDRSIASDQTVIECIGEILSILSENDVTYIHCLGGHGRTGTIVAILLGKMYGLSADEALRLTSVYHITRWINNTPHKSSKYIQKSPQTKCQIDQVRRLLK